ncbi:LysM peptidoglycan-binding domain-containing protein [Pseudarthrobacter sp. P1]|uniref:lytic transglycosylase n=1 Tax=Pseudarthrobacter sp. P1 TaxID=3418418 RepID=UPI003CF146DA
MTSDRKSRQSPKTTKQLAVAATAAIPVVMLSSMALAQPAAAAAPAAPVKASPSAMGHGAVAAASTATSNIPAALVAGTVPTGVAPVQVAVPDQHIVQAGDTVSAIAAHYGLDTNTVLALNGLGPATMIHPGQALSLTGSAAAEAAPAAPAAASASYVVKTGDTVSAIAAAHGLSVHEVLAANGLTASTIIHPGQELSLSGGGGSAASADAAPAAASASYVVRAGDTVSAIAAAHGLSVHEVLAANGLTASTIIKPGQQLSLGSAVAAASSSITAVEPSPAAVDALVPSTFLDYTYPQAVVAQANVNKAALLAAPVPSPAQMQQLVANTAVQMGVDSSLAQAFALQESGFDQQAVSPANAIGTMQVIPQAGEWASELVGRPLNLLDPHDNVTAGVAIIRALVNDAPSLDEAIAGYYQGAYSVSLHGMYPDTEGYVASVKAIQASFQ